MKREFLTGELGLSKEITEKIMAQYGESVNSLKSENARLSSENENYLKKVNDAENLASSLAEMTNKNQQLEESIGKLTYELNESKLTGAVTSALISAGAKNVIAAGALIDKGKIVFDDSGIHGLSEQIEAAKNECGYLFYDGDYSSGMAHGSTHSNQDGFTSFARAAAKLS